jgi:hypothetical protein
MAVEFRVTFYRTEQADAPLVGFLEHLRQTQPSLHRLVTAGLTKLRQSDYHGPPLTKQVDEELGILELRVGRTDIARVFFFFQPGREIVCTNGYVKKAQKVDVNELDRARRYKADWERRYGNA